MAYYVGTKEFPSVYAAVRYLAQNPQPGVEVTSEPVQIKPAPPTKEPTPAPAPETENATTFTFFRGVELGDANPNALYSRGEATQVTETELREYFDAKGSGMLRQAFGDFDNYLAYMTEREQLIQSGDYDVGNWNEATGSLTEDELMILEGEDLTQYSDSDQDAYTEAYGERMQEQSAAYDNWVNSEANQALLAKYGVTSTIYNNDGDKYEWNGSAYVKTVKEQAGLGDYVKMAGIIAVGALAGGAGIGQAVAGTLNLGTTATAAIAGAVNGAVSQAVTGIVSGEGVDLSLEGIITSAVTAGVLDTEIAQEALQVIATGNELADAVIQAGVIGGATQLVTTGEIDADSLALAMLQAGLESEFSEYLDQLEQWGETKLSELGNIFNTADESTLNNVVDFLQDTRDSIKQNLDTKLTEQFQETADEIADATEEAFDELTDKIEEEEEVSLEELLGTASYLEGAGYVEPGRMAYYIDQDGNAVLGDRLPRDVTYNADGTYSDNDGNVYTLGGTAQVNDDGSINYYDGRVDNIYTDADGNNISEVELELYDDSGNQILFPQDDGSIADADGNIVYGPPRQGVVNLETDEIDFDMSPDSTGRVEIQDTGIYDQDDNLLYFQEDGVWYEATDDGQRVVSDDYIVDDPQVVDSLVGLAEGNVSYDESEIDYQTAGQTDYQSAIEAAAQSDDIGVFIDHLTESGVGVDDFGRFAVFNNDVETLMQMYQVDTPQELAQALAADGYFVHTDGERIVIDFNEGRNVEDGGGVREWDDSLDDPYLANTDDDTEVRYIDPAEPRDEADPVDPVDEQPLTRDDGDAEQGETGSSPDGDETPNTPPPVTRTDDPLVLPPVVPPPPPPPPSPPPPSPPPPSPPPPSPPPPSPPPARPRP